MRIGLIEPCNFINFPTGGQLTFAKQLLATFGNDLILIGVSTDKKSIGKWEKLIIDDIEYDFFPYLYLTRSSKKPLIPIRLKNYIALCKYKKEINKKRIDNIFTQSPDSLLAIRNFGFPNICYYFAGTENPLIISRYKIANYLSFLYDKYFLPQLVKTNLILAAADDNSINELVERSKGILTRNKIIKFPTRLDTTVYHKIDKNCCRSMLKIPVNQIIIVTTGRLGWFKGWKFMIDCFRLFKLEHPEANFYFIGNGEDHEKIISYISQLDLDNAVHLVGFKDPKVIAQYLNSADLFIMGSYKEGWSTSLIEAVSCGVPSCVTNFSSAKEIIDDGVSGYVTHSHNELQFVKNMNKCLLIDRSKIPQENVIEKYSITGLKQDLMRIWKLI